jgi:UDP-glucuronate 4-epimerase
MGLQNGDYHVINLGNNRTVSLAEMVSTLERLTGKQAKIDRLPDQPGDLPHTRADISRAAELLGYSPQTTFEDGVKSFLNWLTKGPA